LYNFKTPAVIYKLCSFLTLLYHMSATSLYPEGPDPAKVAF
jgi:hypothetical protein